MNEAKIGDLYEDRFNFKLILIVGVRKPRIFYYWLIGDYPGNCEYDQSMYIPQSDIDYFYNKVC